MTSALDNRTPDEETQLTERLQLAACQSSRSLTQDEVDRLLGVIPDQPSRP